MTTRKPNGHQKTLDTINAKEQDILTGQPVTNITIALLALGAIFFLPVVILVILTIGFTIYQVTNYIYGLSKIKQSVQVSEQMIIDQRIKRRTIVMLITLYTLFQTVAVAVLLFIFANEVFSLNYLAIIYVGFWLYAIGLAFNKFTKHSRVLYLNTATPAIAYTDRFRTLVFAVFAQYSLTEYFIGGNTTITLLILFIASVYFSSFIRGRVYYEELAR